MPYVGVSGVSAAGEARNVVSLMRRSGFTMQAGHIPMMGLQVSWKSLDFGLSKGNNRVPRLGDLPLILEAVKGEVFPTIHYYTKRQEKVVTEIEKVIEYNSIYDSGLVGGLQINGVFPKPDSLEELKKAYPSLKLTLQTRIYRNEIETLAEELAAYHGIIDYALLDSSGGRGREFDSKQMIEAYRILKDKGLEAGIVFAGGITGENVVHKIKTLVKETGEKGFSIDAEGGLRDRLGDGYGNDRLNLDKVSAYLKGASEALFG